MIVDVSVTSSSHVYIEQSMRSKLLTKENHKNTLYQNIFRQTYKTDKTLTSNIWSRKGIPVELSATPLPSKFIFTNTFVSFVSLFTSPIRADPDRINQSNRKMESWHSGMRFLFSYIYTWVNRRRGHRWKPVISGRRSAGDGFVMLRLRRHPQKSRGRRRRRDCYSPRNQKPRAGSWSRNLGGGGGGVVEDDRRRRGELHVVE